MLAVLDDDTLAHPALECVFTTQEETGLTGAAGLDKSLISARTMINLDSEEEGIATVSCAGGMRFTMTRPITRHTASGKLLTIDVSGLLGGHSGTDINKERQNGIILLARLINRVLHETGAQMCIRDRLSTYRRLLRTSGRAPSDYLRMFEMCIRDRGYRALHRAIPLLQCASSRHRALFDAYLFENMQKFLENPEKNAVRAYFFAQNGIVHLDDGSTCTVLGDRILGYKGQRCVAQPMCSWRIPEGTPDSCITLAKLLTNQPSAVLLTTAYTLLTTVRSAVIELSLIHI